MVYNSVSWNSKKEDMPTDTDVETIKEALQDQGTRVQGK